MEIPKFHETFMPILEVLSDGKEWQRAELRREVQKRFFSMLSEELLSRKTKSGDPFFLNRIGWGIAYIKQGKFIKSPRRGVVQITKKGLDFLKKGELLTFTELRKDSDYIQHEKDKLDDNKKNHPEINDDMTPGDKIESGITEIEKQVESELLEKLKSVDPYYFEKIILQILHRMGYGEFIETKKSGDGGIDGIINEDQLGLGKIYMQAKRYNENKVREKDIRNFIGAMSGDTTKGVFVTTSDFDDAAIQKAKEAHHTIVLVNGKELASLMYKYNVGIQIQNTYETKEIDEDFFEGS